MLHSMAQSMQARTATCEFSHTVKLRLLTNIATGPGGICLLRATALPGTFCGFQSPTQQSELISTSMSDAPCQ